MFKTGETSGFLTWQSAVIASAWLLSTVAVGHFLHHMPQGVLDFDGKYWYFVDQTKQLEQIGTIGVGFDAQNGMLLRFESEFKRVTWMWLASESQSNDWHDLRRAVYSRPALLNSPDLI